ncbi:MAG TPA: xylulokinase [Microvirga sp.]|jgi:xylulokinase
MTSFLGIDIGTSSVKALLIDERQVVLAEAGADLVVHRQHPLWSEQDPHSWWDATNKVVASIRDQQPDAFRALCGIGLSGQQHGATLLDDTGEVLRPCILWNDGRSAAECRELLERVPDLALRCSNIAMPGFTAPKLLWVAKYEPDLFKRISKVLLPKDYVRFRMTDAYVSDLSDSAGTLWMNVAERQWDDTIIRASGLNPSMMPDLVEGSDISGYLSSEVADAWGLAGRRIPIAGGAGDNAASAVGIGAVQDGQGFISLGTSGVVFVTTDRPVSLPHRTLHAFCHALPHRWHGMAVTLSAAQSLSWLANITGHASDIGGLIKRAEGFAADPENVRSAPLFLPYLTGERTPHNDPQATGQFARLRVEHDVGALAFAVLEGVACALADCLAVLAEANATPTTCMLVGGGSRSRFWAQIIADRAGISLDLPEGSEHGAAAGAARLAMLAAGCSQDDVCKQPHVRERISPDLSDPELSALRRSAVLELYNGARNS